MSDFLEKALQLWAAVPVATEEQVKDALLQAGGDVAAATSLLLTPRAASPPPPPPPPPQPRPPPAPRAGPLAAPPAAALSAPLSSPRTSALTSATPRPLAVSRELHPAVRAASLLPYLAHPGGEAKYRLLAPAEVRKEAEEGAALLCELEEGCVVEVAEEVEAASGDRRVRIVDPVWCGWITRRVASTGAVLLEPAVTKQQPAAAGAGASPPPAASGRVEGVEGDAGGASEARGAEAMKPLSERERRERGEGMWKAGMMVLLTGLVEAREYNGRSGVLAAWLADRARYEVRLGNRAVRVRAECVDMHPMQRKREQETKGDEVIFMTTDEQAARAGTYAVKLDPQFWYDRVIDRVFEASNEYEVLELPVEWTEDLALIKKQYRKISLSVHPDKNKHPQADAAFRKVYGAFETLSDSTAQRKLLFTLSMSGASAEEKARFEQAGAEDEDDTLFQWWWDASVPEVEKAAEEAEGSQYDQFAAAYVSDGLGGSVNQVRWIGLQKGMDLHAKERAIFIDCRESADYHGGMIPGAYHVPMSAVQRYGIVNVLGPELIHAMLTARRHHLIVVYSNVATPFSRCRAFCRWLLRAGHKTLPVARFRRLRGGIFGWKHKDGKIARPLTARGMHDDETIEARLRDVKLPQEETIDLN
ncbi:hypothetical protein AB1Y20_002195 [Prymnesium parvum]|uniref:Rhodanese domain-containing protein n=1 Tax=Prymnesium parvum TaxID=97485 RepID=A0AB34J9N6_PRYPA